MNARLVIFVFVLTGSLAFLLMPPKRVEAESDPAATGLRVVELFTSQGCSSCPPADRLLSELAGRDDVLALSFHVDYWDRLGWRDPFSLKESSKRQYDYAAAFDSDRVYTPQAVIGGVTEAVGSRAADVETKLASIAPADANLKVDVETTRGKKRVSVVVDGNVSRVVIASVLPTAATQVSRGENGGRTLAHVNVVRDFVVAKPVRGRAIGEVQLAEDPANSFLAIYTHAADGTILSARVVR